MLAEDLKERPHGSKGLEWDTSAAIGTEPPLEGSKVPKNYEGQLAGSTATGLLTCWYPFRIFWPLFPTCLLVSIAVEAGPSKPADAKEEDKLWEFSGWVKTGGAFCIRWEDDADSFVSEMVEESEAGGPFLAMPPEVGCWFSMGSEMSRSRIYVASFHLCRPPNTVGTLLFWRGCPLFFLMLDRGESWGYIESAMIWRKNNMDQQQ